MRWQQFGGVKLLSKGTQAHKATLACFTSKAKVFSRTISKPGLGIVRLRNKEMPKHKATLLRFT